MLESNLEFPQTCASDHPNFAIKDLRAEDWSTMLHTMCFCSKVINKNISCWIKSNWKLSQEGKVLFRQKLPQKYNIMSWCLGLLIFYWQFSVLMARIRGSLNIWLFSTTIIRSRDLRWLIAWWTGLLTRRLDGVSYWCCITLRYLWSELKIAGGIWLMTLK